MERTNPHLLTQPLIMSKRAGRGGSAKRLIGRPVPQGRNTPAPPVTSKQEDDDDGVLAKDSPILEGKKSIGALAKDSPILERTKSIGVLARDSPILEQKDSIVSSVSEGSTGPDAKAKDTARPKQTTKSGPAPDRSITSDTKAKDAARPKQTKKSGPSFRMFKGKTPKVEAARSAVEEIKPVPYISDDNDLFEDEPAVALVQPPPARAGAIEIGDNGLPFFKSHSYMSDDPEDDDVVNTGAAAFVEDKVEKAVGKNDKDAVDFVLQVRSSDNDDAELMRSRSSDS